MNIQRYGIDISYANKKLDFEKIREGGVSFAIIRTGYRQKTDDMFESHIKNATAAGQIGRAGWGERVYVSV